MTNESRGTPENLPLAVFPLRDYLDDSKRDHTFLYYTRITNAVFICFSAVIPYGLVDMQGHAYPFVFIQPSVPFPPPAYDPGVCPPPLPTGWTNAGTPYATALPPIPQDKMTYPTGPDGVCYAPTHVGPLVLETFTEEQNNSERQEVSEIFLSSQPKSGSDFSRAKKLMYSKNLWWQSLSNNTSIPVFFIVVDRTILMSFLVVNAKRSL